MNWKKKALIMRACASLPGGPQFYRVIQKRFGRLSNDYRNRLPILLDVASMLKNAGKPIAGSFFFEVGTGHLPVVPVFLGLMGASSVLTVDLHRRMDYTLLVGLLNRIAQDRDTLEQRLLPFADPAVLNKQFLALERFKHDPVECLRRLAIQYNAPGDAARCGLPDATVDCHLSITVLEHVPRNVITDIMTEAHRIVRDTGVAVHLIDMTDHFQHQDASISRNHFLRYSPDEWRRIAGNEFAYTNRLKASDYVDIFTQSGFDIAQKKVVVGGDDLLEGFPLHSDFLKYSREDLCTTEMMVLLQKRLPVGLPKVQGE